MAREPVDPQAPDWLEECLPALPAFLMTQRWFGGKSRVIRRASIEDACSLPTGDLALLLVAVSYAEGPPERYVLLLQRQDDPSASGTPLVTARNGGHIVEAAADPAAVRRLLAAVSAGDLGTTSRGRLQSADWTRNADRGLRTAESGATGVRGEQSNTSVRVGPGLVFKLLRRVADGENPEVEMSRFLTTRTVFRSAPALEGSLTYSPLRGAASTLGVLQEWIENGGDGWSVIVNQLRTSREQPAALAHDVAALGAVTAEFHATLGAAHADPAFAPERVRPAHVERWRAGLIAQAARSLALVGHHVDQWDPPTRALGESLLGMAARVAEVADALLLDARNDFNRIRIHGDYHLGQTLKTDKGFVIIDFEGEPTRPLDERREKQCALKDVAGMFRSFDYASHTTDGRTTDSGDRAALRTWFLDAYLSTAGHHGAAFLPRHDEERERWIAFFELEKALYELEYEINNRPGWVRIPLEGVCRALTGSPGGDSARRRGRDDKRVD